VDDPGAVRGEVRDPAVLDQLDEDRGEAILDRVRAEGDHPRFPGLARRLDAFDREVDDGLAFRVETAWLGRYRHVSALDVHLDLALEQRLDVQRMSVKFGIRQRSSPMASCLENGQDGYLPLAPCTGQSCQ